MKLYERIGVMNTLAQIMEEWGSAVSGDYNNLDGDFIENVIISFRDEILNPSDKTLEEWRSDLGLCPKGGGHWLDTWGDGCENC